MSDVENSQQIEDVNTNIDNSGKPMSEEQSQEELADKRTKENSSNDDASVSADEVVYPKNEKEEPSKASETVERANKSFSAKQRTPLNKYARMMLGIIIASGVIVVAALVLYFSMIRYETVLNDNGELLSTFFGKVDSKTGLPFEGTIKYSDGTTGELTDGTHLVLSTGLIYDGELTDHRMNGYGVLQYPNGDRYEGSFTGGLFDGQGTYYFSGGDTYSGTLTKGVITGEGTYTWSDGSFYTGSFVNGLRQGYGTFSYANGDLYFGYFVNNQRVGSQCTYRWANGDTYVGEFEDDKAEGQGTMTWVSGEQYVGSFKNWLMDGQGTYTWTNGRTYTGAFEEGKQVD